MSKKIALDAGHGITTPGKQTPKGIKEKSEKKTPEQLTAENEQLKREVTGLQLALCEVYETVEALTDAKGVK